MQRAKHSIDWKALHARLSAVNTAIASASEPSVERCHELLLERTRRYARAAERAGDARERLEVVEFRLAHETYAIGCAFVTEVAPLGDYAVLPNAPGFVLGVTSLRGRMVSVVDLGRLFDLPSSGLTDRNRVLILDFDGMELGLLADAVDAVTHIFVDQLSPPVATMSGLCQRLCRGVLPGGRVLLDAPNLLADKMLASGMLSGEFS